MNNSVDLFWAPHLGRHNSKSEGRHLRSEGGMIHRGRYFDRQGASAPAPSALDPQLSAQRLRLPAVTDLGSDLWSIHQPRSPSQTAAWPLPEWSICEGVADCAMLHF